MLIKLLAGAQTDELSNVVISISRHVPLADEIVAAGARLLVGDWRHPLEFVKTVSALGKELPPSVVVAWMYHAQLVATILKPFFFPGSLLAWNVRQGLENREQMRPASRLVLRVLKFLSIKPDIILYNSRRARQQHRDFGFSARHDTLIPNGFALPELDAKVALRHRLHHEYEVPETAFVILHVARFHVDKDHESFFRAMALATRQRTAVPVYVIAVGTGVEASNQELRSMIPADLRDSVILLGEQRKLDKFYGGADLFVLSSRAESFPNVLGEAMSWGLPCVATDVGDCRELTDSGSGWLVSPRDPEALANAVSEALVSSPDELAERGRRAREKIAERFSMNFVRQEFDKALAGKAG